MIRRAVSDDGKDKGDFWFLVSGFCFLAVCLAQISEAIAWTKHVDAAKLAVGFWFC